MSRAGETFTGKLCLLPSSPEPHHRCCFFLRWETNSGARLAVTLHRPAQASRLFHARAFDTLTDKHNLPDMPLSALSGAWEAVASARVELGLPLQLQLCTDACTGRGSLLGA